MKNYIIAIIIMNSIATIAMIVWLFMEYQVYGVIASFGFAVAIVICGFTLKDWANREWFKYSPFSGGKPKQGEEDLRADMSDLPQPECCNGGCCASPDVGDHSKPNTNTTSRGDQILNMLRQIENFDEEFDVDINVHIKGNDAIELIHTLFPELKSESDTPSVEDLIKKVSCLIDDINEQYDMYIGLTTSSPKDKEILTSILGEPKWEQSLYNPLKIRESVFEALDIIEKELDRLNDSKPKVKPEQERIDEVDEHLNNPINEATEKVLELIRKRKTLKSQQQF